VGKFADRAVPALIAQMAGAGARRARLEAVLVGGAQMFSLGASTLEIGRRNEEAVREALKREGVGVSAAVTGGTKGRTVRVHVDDARVTVKEPGADEVEIFSDAAKVAA
jgi:chemotaxis protein CheD